MEYVLEFNHVWKKFRKGEKINSLRDAIPHLFTRKGKNISLEDQEFWAVKDISFNIKKGEVVGIMGANGAGKSTVLKLLSRIIIPNKGSMQINGRLSALIEVTAGFHPELSGRENVYLNATILGMRKKEIDDKFDEIVEFSGVKEFIDTPVKRYSSGMYSRLGFSVAAHMDPEILIVDEVLSVGDISFQAKCAQKMRELMSSGATIILVSHQIPLIQSLCKRVILLNHGEVIKDGPTEEIVPEYQNLIFKTNEDAFKRKVKSTENQVKVKQESLIEITNVTIEGSQEGHKEEFKIGEDLNIKVDYYAKKEIENPIVILDIIRSDGVLCCSINSQEFNIQLNKVIGHGHIEFDLGKINLASGIYLVKISFWEREMIHPYVVRSSDIIRIIASSGKGLTKAVFLPEVTWKISK